MSQFIDLTGHRFGRWTVVSRAENYSHNKGYCAAWNCVCDCGSERVVLANNLIRGKSKSCGCYKNDIHRKRCQTEKGKIKYTSLSREPTIDEMLKVLLGDEYESIPEEDQCEKAVSAAFYSCWFKFVRDEQAVMRRYKRDHPTCEMCGKQCDTELHHIRPVAEYGGNEPENILWLCRDCHKAIEVEKMRK